MAKFCKYCGNKTDGANCNCPDSSKAGRGYSPPDGFTLDPDSGLFYKLTPGKDETGQSGRWITWFYPDTGEYVQDFEPDAPTSQFVNTAARVEPVQYPAHTPQLANPRPVKKAAAKKKLALIHIIMPVAALIVGVLISFIQFGGTGADSGGSVAQPPPGVTGNGQAQTPSESPRPGETTPSGTVSINTVVRTISAGRFHTVGLKPDGTVVAVGNNDFGQLEVGGWTDIVSVSAGIFSTVGLKSDGTVVAVGYSDAVVAEISGWGNIVDIAAGGSFVLGLQSDGRAIRAGGVSGGHELNLNDWTNFVAISAESDRAVALRESGTIAAGGLDSYEYQTSGWTNIAAIDSGESHTTGLREDGTVAVIGAATGTIAIGASNWSGIVAVAAGGAGDINAFVIGLQTDGRVVMATNSRTSAFELDGWSDIVAITGGRDHAVGLRADGAVVAVGGNSHGQVDVDDWILTTTAR